MARAFPTDVDTGYLGDKPDAQTYQVMVIDDVAHRIHTVTVHSFMLGDVDDPDIYAAQPLYDWEHSDHGQWVMEHAIETPSWHRMADHVSYGYRYVIRAKLLEQDYLIWALKFK